jgi:hypothetical protein
MHSEQMWAVTDSTADPSFAWQIMPRSIPTSQGFPANLHVSALLAAES